MVADNKIINIGHFSKFTIAQVEHFADDGERGLVTFGNITQVQERDERFGVGILHFQTGITQHNDMVIFSGMDTFQKAPVSGIAMLKGDFLIGEFATFLLDDTLRLNRFGGDGRIGHKHSLRTFGNIIIEFA